MAHRRQLFDGYRQCMVDREAMQLLEKETINSMNEFDEKARDKIRNLTKAHPIFQGNFLENMSRYARKYPKCIKIVMEFALKFALAMEEEVDNFPTEELVRAVLTVDSMYRKMNPIRQDDDLHVISNYHTRILGDMPGYLKPAANIPKQDISIQKCIKRLRRNLVLTQILDHAELKDCILVAGTYISDTLISLPGGDYEEKSICIYFYGIDERDAQKKMDIMAEILEQCKKDNTNEGGLPKPMFVNTRSMRRAKEVMTGDKETVESNFTTTANYLGFNSENYQYRIYYSIYGSKSHILHSIAHGSSAVGYDGDNIYFTTLSLFSQIFTIEIFDYTKSDLTSFLGLHRSNNRNFGVIFPGAVNVSLLNFPEVSNMSVDTHRNVNSAPMLILNTDDIMAFIMHFDMHKYMKEVTVLRGLRYNIEDDTLCDKTSYDNIKNNNITLTTDYETYYKNICEYLHRCANKKENLNADVNFIKDVFEDETIKVIGCIISGATAEEYYELAKPLIEKNNTRTLDVLQKIKNRKFYKANNIIPRIYPTAGSFYGTNHKRFDIGLPWDKQRLLWIVLLKKDNDTPMCILNKNCICLIILAYQRLIEYDLREYMNHFILKADEIETDNVQRMEEDQELQDDREHSWEGDMYGNDYRPMMTNVQRNMNQMQTRVVNMNPRAPIFYNEDDMHNINEPYGRGEHEEEFTSSDYE